MLLILHGVADRRVPTFQGTKHFRILAARGKAARIITGPGSPYFPVLWEERLEMMRDLADWLVK
jgi:dipeptidyl aminopeptidase/acylaminoacyl peptidase